MPPAPQRPNILYILTDQQSASAIRCAGNPDVHTPHIDRIAAQGIRFQRAYCAYPLCTPARASMFSGLSPHETGVTYNGQEIHPALRPREIGNLLARAGYDCAYAGKWHVPHIAMPENNDHGFRVISGFDDNRLAQRAIEYMRQPRPNPFFLVAAYDNPHNICEWAREQTLPWGPIPQPPTIDHCPPLPPNHAADPSEPGAIRSFRNWFRNHHALGHAYTPDQWRQYRWAYYRIVERVDREVGRILDALDQLQLADRTLVIFSSDHGDMAGAHQFTQKTVFYDEAVRVPLLFRGPGVSLRGAVEPRRLVSNGLDLLPTLCDFAAIAPPDGLLGRSLRPFLEGRPPAQWRENLIIESLFRCGKDVDYTGRMVVTEGHTYAAYSAGVHREQLFDLAADPGECVNLARVARSRETLLRHRQALREWCLATNDHFGGKHYSHPDAPFMLPGDEYGLPQER